MLRRRGRPGPALARPRRHAGPGAGGRARRGAAADGGPVGAVLGPRRRRRAVPAEAMAAVLAAGRRAHDLVVVDLPRTLGRRRPRRARRGRAACCSSCPPRCGPPRPRAGSPRRSGCCAATCASSCAARARRARRRRGWPRARAAAGRHAAPRAGPRPRPRAGRAAGPPRPRPARRPLRPAARRGGPAAALGGVTGRPRRPPSSRPARPRAAAGRRRRRVGPRRPRSPRRCRRRAGRCTATPQLRAVLLALQSEIVGAGPLEPLLRDPDVTDVLVNGPGEVWVDRGEGLERTAVRFADDAAVRRLAQRLAAPSGRRLDDAQPWVDARLAGGVRLHAVLPPVAPGGTCLSLRVPRRRVFTLTSSWPAGAAAAEAAARCSTGWSARARPSSSPAARAPARRPCCRRCCPGSTPATGCCSSRTPGSWRRTTRTSSGWRPARPTSRAPAR